MSNSEHSFSEMIAGSRARIPELWNDITEICDSVHPLELLSHLSLFLMHAENDFPDVEENARWQVRIELIAWYFLRSGFMNDQKEVFVDDAILSPLEEKLDAYFHDVGMCLLEPQVVSGESDLNDSLRFMFATDALNVRGEGITEQIREIALGVYGPHSDWFQRNLGFTIEKAFTITEGLTTLIARKFHDQKSKCHRERDRLAEEYRELLARDPDTLDADQKEDQKAIQTVGADEAAERSGFYAMFRCLRDTLGISEVELAGQVEGLASREEVGRYLERMSQSLGTVTTEPNPIGFNPLVSRPLIADDGKYYLPVSPILYDTLLSTFHFDLLTDESYRHKYDEVRARWLEEQALEAFNRLLPGAKMYRSLQYGPKKHRQELDGLVWYDNKLILIECKWKTLTQAAQMGDVEAICTDIEKSVAAAFEQSSRARTFIANAAQPIVFVDAEGDEITIDPAVIREIYDVSLLGRGAMAVLTANLPLLAPPALFPNGNFPWAGSLIDLKMICDLLEFPSQLFDYFKRRERFVRETKKLIHDEWDILGLYLTNGLSMDIDGFDKANFGIFGKSDYELDQYLRSRNNHLLPQVEKPARKIPSGLKAWIRSIEDSDQIGRSDFIVELLGQNDRALQELWRHVDQALAKTRADGQIHSISLHFKNGQGGITFLCTRGDPEEMSRRLEELCVAKKYRLKAPVWLGVGVDVILSDPPHALGYLTGPWVEDVELALAVEALLGTE